MALLHISEPGSSPDPHQRRIGIGIDLGTTHSLVAAVRDSLPQCLPDEQGRVQWIRFAAGLALGDDVQAAVGIGQLACEGVSQVMDADVLDDGDGDGAVEGIVGRRATLAGLAVNADDRIVTPTKVCRINRQIGHIPRRFGLLDGKAFADACIVELDNYKGARGKTYKDDYRAILCWVVDRVKEKKPGLLQQSVSEAAPAKDNPFREWGEQNG